MNNTKPLFLDQIEVFKLQFQQLIQRSHRVSCDSKTLYLNEFSIYEDRNRLIKSNGYEILLEDIHSISFKCEFDIVLEGEYKNRKIKIAFQ